MAGGCGELPRKKERSISICRDKRDNKSRSKTACPEKKSGNGKDEFGRKACPKVVEEKKEIECHESLKNFFYKNDKSKPSEKPKEETKCDESTEKTKEKYKCKDTSKTDDSRDCCSSMKDSTFGPRKKVQSACAEIGSSNMNPGLCKHFGKQYVEISPKPKTEDTNDNHLQMPEPQVMTTKPCLPRVERGISAKRKKPGCIPRDIDCTQLKKPAVAEFFCIDVRNRQMNECIKQYMKSDPSQIKIQCSQLAKKRMHTASCAPSPPPSPPMKAGFLPPKYRQVMGRWLPTAGLYLAATAAATVWLTEWSVVVDRIPFYKDKEVESQATTPPEVPPSTSEESDE